MAKNKAENIKINESNKELLSQINNEINSNNDNLNNDVLNNFDNLNITGTIEVVRPDLVKKAKKERKQKNVNDEDDSIITIKGGKCYEFFKRFFDILLSSLAIIVLSPLLIIIALLVKCTSKGPVFFKDKRIGLHGKKITVLKFRSMYVDAETRIDQYLTPEQKQIWLTERKIDNDPRITKVGNFLRKTSLDELAQLFNIFAGQISIVGPRPIKNYEILSAYTPYEIDRLLSVKPGLTGYWQVYGRSDVTYEDGQRQKEELAYLPRRSLWFDFKIIMLTIPSVLKRKGAK
jgi:lipopolysaccharide/colanic/teichoic acid biosynthesis glycosyltransferase